MYVSSATIPRGAAESDASANTVVGAAQAAPIAQLEIPRFTSAQKTFVEFAATATTAAFAGCAKFAGDALPAAIPTIDVASAQYSQPPPTAKCPDGPVLFALCTLGTTCDGCSLHPATAHVSTAPPSAPVMMATFGPAAAMLALESIPTLASLLGTHPPFAHAYSHRTPQP